MQKNVASFSPSVKAEYNEIVEYNDIRNHYHNSYQIIYVVEGEAEFTISGKTYEVKNNSLIIINNLEHHSLKFKGNLYRRYYILIKPDHFQVLVNEPVLLSILKHRPDNFNHVIPLYDEDRSIVLNFIKDIYEEVKFEKAFCETKVGCLLQLLLIYVYRNHKRSFPVTSLNSSIDKIHEVQKYIEINFNEDIRLKDVASLFFIDMYYLSHLFKNITGFTFKEYVIFQRISHARDLLVYTTDDITRVGINSGFNNVNNFIRIFKKYERITPLQYRKKYLDNT